MSNALQAFLEIVRALKCYQDSLRDFIESSPFQGSLFPFLHWQLLRHLGAGGVMEIRTLHNFMGRQQTYSGYFDNLEAILFEIVPLPESPRSRLPYGGIPRIMEAMVCATLNPVRADFLARANNRIIYAKNTTSDEDIVAISTVVIDIDPRRPAGISSTDLEKEKGRRVADNIFAFFDKRRIKPILIDSGNGWHLIIPTVPYRDVPQASIKVGRLLEYLKNEFGNDDVEIDTTVSNPARILKLPGTLAMKGDHIPERPHRWSQIVGDFQPPQEVDLLS